MRLTHPTALVLLSLSRGHRYGFEIMDATGLQSGAVYPILRRLEAAGMISGRWEAVSKARGEQRPPRRYYQLTGAGRQAVRDATDRFPGLGRLLDAGSSGATA